MRLSDQSLQRKTVIAADGRAIGAISALFLDAATWQVESLQVTLHKDVADRLGAPRSVFHAGTIEVPVGLVQSVSDTVVLSHDLAGLSRIFAGAQGSAPSAGDEHSPAAH